VSIAALFFKLIIIIIIIKESIVVLLSLKLVLNSLISTNQGFCTHAGSNTGMSLYQRPHSSRLQETTRPLSPQRSPITTPNMKLQWPFFARLAGWSILLSLAMLWRRTCSFGDYDLRQSSSSCLVLKSAPGVCSVAPAVCVGPPWIQALAPRWLGLVAAVVGPLWIWVPLLLILFQVPASLFPAATAHSANGLRLLRIPLAVAAIWYLSWINVVRYTIFLSPVHFDPSGHIFVFSLQLLPLWFFYFQQPASDVPVEGSVETSPAEVARVDSPNASSAVSPARVVIEPPSSLPSETVSSSAALNTNQFSTPIFIARLLTVVELLLWFLSATTAAFFHSGPDICAAYALALLQGFTTVWIIRWCQMTARSLIHQRALHALRLGAQCASAAYAVSLVIFLCFITAQAFLKTVDLAKIPSVFEFSLRTLYDGAVFVLLWGGLLHVPVR
jgi:hypothetical protein